MYRLKIILKCLLLVFAIIFVLPVVWLVLLYNCADMGEPELSISPSDYPTLSLGDTLYCKDSYLRQDASKLWELYIAGSGQEKGAKQGSLTRDLMKYQEDVFIDQIRELIPSDSYLSFLRNFIIIFNRNLGEYIPQEYREEIVALSEFCTDEYNAIGSPYERQLNYHAAHDIGHTMQQYMLVACSSFASWREGEDLIIARNFDFYVGDDFARNKVITFAAPDEGYKYVSVGWAAMVGVLSGMNEKGLTVTINAAKGAIPKSAAMPISLLAREILQYSSTIEQAYEIAAAHDTFVSESLLIGSLQDKKAAIIEKTPSKIALYFSPTEQIACTNHYQSPFFALDDYNLENIEFSDSKYRLDRLGELLGASSRLNAQSAVDILRDRYGKGGKDVGLGNEMTLNQSIAHHSVVFSPALSRMWVSTSPWQSGEFVCYDLQGFFNGEAYPRRFAKEDLAADSLFLARDYPRLLKYREAVKQIKKSMSSDRALSGVFVSAFKGYNPHNYYTYRLLGDYFCHFNDEGEAEKMYRRALECEIPYKSERIDIERELQGLLN